MVTIIGLLLYLPYAADAQNIPDFSKLFYNGEERPLHDRLNAVTVGFEQRYRTHPYGSPCCNQYVDIDGKVLLIVWFEGQRGFATFDGNRVIRIISGVEINSVTRIGTEFSQTQVCVRELTQVNLAHCIYIDHGP